jgi:hypothetical protein
MKKWESLFEGKKELKEISVSTEEKIVNQFLDFLVSHRRVEDIASYILTQGDGIDNKNIANLFIKVANYIKKNL